MKASVPYSIQPPQTTFSLLWRNTVNEILIQTNYIISTQRVHALNFLPRFTFCVTRTQRLAESPSSHYSLLASFFYWVQTSHFGCCVSDCCGFRRNVLAFLTTAISFVLFLYSIGCFKLMKMYDLWMLITSSNHCSLSGVYLMEFSAVTRQNECLYVHFPDPSDNTLAVGALLAFYYIYPRALFSY